VVVVYATRERQIERLMARDRISREEAISRIDAQLPLEEKIAYADYVINNNGTVEETMDQVTRFYKLIRGKERS
jgi:dephospho-CoA kinase